MSNLRASNQIRPQSQRSTVNPRPGTRVEVSSSLSLTGSMDSTNSGTEKPANSPESTRARTETALSPEKSEDHDKSNGRWTDEEHRKFLEAFNLYGKNWKLVQGYVGTRSATQARSHAQKYFAKLTKKGQGAGEAAGCTTQTSTPVGSPLFKSDQHQKRSHKKTCKRAKRLLTYDSETDKDNSNRNNNKEAEEEEEEVVEEPAKKMACVTLEPQLQPLPPPMDPLLPEPWSGNTPERELEQVPQSVPDLMYLQDPYEGQRLDFSDFHMRLPDDFDSLLSGRNADGQDELSHFARVPPS